MGVDGYIFDAVSKECFYFDRLTNLYSHLEHDTPERDVFDRMREKAAGHGDIYVSSDEVVMAMDLAIVGWGTDYHGLWCQAVRHFALERPDGKFFVVTDHDEPPSWHYIDRNVPGAGGPYREVERGMFPPIE